MDLFRKEFVHSHDIKKYLIFLLFISVQVHCFSLSKNSSQDVAVTQMVESPKELNNTNVLLIKNICMLFDHLDAINYFLKSIHVNKLIIVIADDPKDAITMAKYLSRDNRLSLQNKEELPLPQQLLYDQVTNILHALYYNNETSIYIFVYPKNKQNEILETYLTQKIINSAEEINVFLTCEAEFTENSLDRMFQVASNTLLLETYNESIFFLPLSCVPFPEFSCRFFMNAMDQVEKYIFSTFVRFGEPEFSTLVSTIKHNFQNLTAKEKRIFSVLKYTIILAHIFKGVTCSELSSYLKNQGIQFYENQDSPLVKFNYSFNLNSPDDNLKCIGIKLEMMETTSLKFLSSNMSILTDVFVLSDYMLSSFKNVTLLNSKRGIFKHICKIMNKVEAIQEFCFLQYFPGIEVFYDLDSFAQNHWLKKSAWFSKLVSMYENVNDWDESTRLLESQKIYSEIPKTNQYDANLMKNAFFILSNYTENMQVDIKCVYSILGNSYGYKLQVKGKFVSLGNILRKRCSGKIKFIEIFALEKIIIDEDLIQDGEEMQVNIIAPMWEVILNKTINLDGAPADNNWTSWEHKSYVLGTDGLPGLPGRPGGTFFAILGSTINSNGLRISSNGGRGGNGQDGAPGTTRDLSECVRGGAEGVEGAGGMHGVIKLFLLNKFSVSDIQLSVKNGTDGRAGRIGYIDFFGSLKCGKFVNHRSGRNKLGYQPPKKSIVVENFGESVKRFRKFVLNETLICKCSAYTHLYVEIANNKLIPNNYGTLNFIDDFIHLEKYYSVELNKTVTLHLFEAWDQGFRDFFRKQNENTNIHTTKVLLSLDTLVSRKIHKLKNNFYENSILLIEKYLKGCILESEKLKNTEILVDMKIITQRYKADFEEEIEEAKQLLSHELQDYLTKRIDDLNNEIQQLVKEIEEMIEIKKTEIKDLEKERQKLQGKLALRVIVGFLQFAFLALSFINPVCAIVGAALSVGTNMLESQILDANGNSESQIVIESMNRNYQTLQEMKRTRSNKAKATLRGVNKANNVFDAVELGMQTIKKISNDRSAIDRVNDKINQTLKDIEDLENYKTAIHEQLEPFIERIHTQLVNKNNEFHNSSITYLEFERWRTDDYLSDVSSQLELWTDKFNVGESVKVTMRKLKKAMETIIRVHTLIKELRYKIKDAEFSSHIAEAPYQITNTEDMELKNNVIKLTHIHYANDIIDEYNKWTIAYKQFSFPLIIESTDINEALNTSSVDPLLKANIIVEKMKFLQSHLYKTTSEGQSIPPRAKFGDGGPFSPFYTWNGSEYSSEIKEILEGKTVQLFANISDIQDLNAVKFRDINILFTSPNATVNEELKNDLKSFSVSLTHNGNSYYRCNHEIYLINSGTFNFGIKFFMNRRKRFVDENIDYILSPFATWTIRLRKNRDRGNFTALAKYTNKVNMELVGQGQFFFLDQNVCDPNLRIHYGK